MVPFHGTGAGVAELSWGQREIWAAMKSQRDWLPVGGAAAFDVPTDLDAVVAALGRSISRHQALRTRLRYEPDGGVRQVIRARGEVPLHVVDVPGDPAAAAAELETRLRRSDFDYEHEWPIRMAVVRHDGRNTHLVAVFCHLALDGAGLAALFRDGLINLFTGNTSADAPPGSTPVDQVEWQDSPAGRRHNQATQRHWRRLLAQVPSRRFGDTDDERDPRHWQVRFHSPAAYLAMRSIMARTGCESSAVLLAAVAVAMVRVTGIGPAVVQVVVHNRFRPGLADTISPVAQTGLCVIDTAGSFDDVVERARQSALSAYLHAYYDPDAMTEMIAELGRERGADIDLGCFYNDRRSPDIRDPDRPQATPRDVTAALTQTTLDWGPHSPKPWERFFVHVDDTPGVVRILCQADTRYLPPDDIAAFLHHFEATLVAASGG